MPRKINPHVGLFVALAALMVALFGWLRFDVNAMEARLVDGQNALRAGQNALVERVTRLEAGQKALEAGLNALAGRVMQIEAGQDKLVERVARLEAGQNALVERMAQIGTGQDKLVERVARIEGRIEGVLAFARGSAFADSATPRDSVPSR